MVKGVWGAPSGAPADGVGAVIAAWTADLCGRTPGKELSTEDERYNAPVVRAPQNVQPVFPPVEASTINKTVVDTRWAST